jgi:hypothetical protein
MDLTHIQIGGGKNVWLCKKFGNYSGQKTYFF